jgi:hypothetical protein
MRKRAMGKFRNAIVLVAPLVVACTMPSPSPSQAAFPSATVTASPSWSPSPSLRPTGWTFVDIEGIDVTDVGEFNGRLIAVGSSYDGPSVEKVLVSEDGLAWNEIDLSRLNLDQYESRFLGPLLQGPNDLLASGQWFNYEDPGGGTLVLRSSDGLQWERVATPEPCFYPLFVADFGFLASGHQRYLDTWCYREDGGEFDPPVGLFASTDGRTWHDLVAALSSPANLAVTAFDGHRLVGFDAYRADPVTEWISDDLGRTWRQVSQPWVSRRPDSIVFGHNQFVVGAGVLRDGNSFPLACTSPDGEAWDCQETGVWIGGRATAVTSTGFVAIYSAPSTSNDRHERTVVATSRDGLHWAGSLEPKLDDVTFYGAAWTSKGLFAWGGTNPEVDPSGHSTPFFANYPAPRP